MLPGAPSSYVRRHPGSAHLLVEISASTLVHDRLTKASIYARAGVPCYWIVNLHDRCIEEYREPDRWKSSYAVVERKTGSETLAINAFPGVVFTVDELLPPVMTEQQTAPGFDENELD